VRPKDFIVKAEMIGRKKKGKREYLNNVKTRGLMGTLNKFLESSVEVPRIKLGKKQTIETLISEEALLFAQSLRDSRGIWKPRIVEI